MKTYKIYKYTNLITGMSYVGQTRKTLKQRAEPDMKGYRGCEKFWEAIQHYGTDCWRSEILWDGLTLDEANIYEQVEIRDNETVDPYGYNLNEGGGGINPSKETLQKMSEKAKEREAKKRAEGYIVSEETRQRISVANTGKKRKPESCQKMSEKAKEREARKKAEGYKVSEETLRKKSENAQKMWNDRRPPKHLAKEFYLTLDPNLPISEIRKILYDKFPDVNQGTVCRWVREWYKEFTGKTLHSGQKVEYNPARALFFSLPTTISLAKKRKIIFDKFLGSIAHGTLCTWTHQWESEIHPSRKEHRSRIEKIPAQQFFCSLPSDMSIQEKRERVYAEFPSVAQRTIYSWTYQWHTELTGSPPRREPWNKGKTGVYSDETLQKISEASKGNTYRLGKKQTPEACAKVSDKLRGRPSPKKGKSISKEQREKQSRAMKGKPAWNKGKRKPVFKSACDFFYSLPADMPLSKKRKTMREKYSDLSPKTIWRWTKQWQSEIYTE